MSIKQKLQNDWYKLKVNYEPLTVNRSIVEDIVISNLNKQIEQDLLKESIREISKAKFKHR